MSQAWNLKSRAHECARTGRPFDEGEAFHTAIYFDTETGEFNRRDVGLNVWEEETSERAPFSYWKNVYLKPESHKLKPEIVAKEGAEGLLRRLVDDDEEHTENARYILAIMLERKRQLMQKDVKHTESGPMLIYEHRKSGEVYIIRDPELRLDEIEAVQEEVAMLLGFSGSAPINPEVRVESADVVAAP